MSKIEVEAKQRSRKRTSQNKRFLDIDVERLKPADWNYKEEGTEQELADFEASVLRDKSVGTLEVRELDDYYFEVINGNHRLVVIQRLGWKKVHCENFGKISKAEAITIASRRNHEWFRQSQARFNVLLKDVVAPEIPVEELAKFMPETGEQLQARIDLLDFDWDKYEQSLQKNKKPETESKSKKQVAEQKTFSIKATGIPTALYEAFINFTVEHDFQTHGESMIHILKQLDKLD